MEQADKKEIIIAAVVFIVYIAFVLARRVCSTVPGSCTTGWIVFGVTFAGGLVILIFKVFR